VTKGLELKVYYSTPAHGDDVVSAPLEQVTEAAVCQWFG